MHCESNSNILVVSHRHHYNVIVVSLENSENDSVLKDWINCGIYLKIYFVIICVGLDTSGFVNIPGADFSHQQLHQSTSAITLADISRIYVNDPDKTVLYIRLYILIIFIHHTMVAKTLKKNKI